MTRASNPRERKGIQQGGGTYTAKVDHANHLINAGLDQENLAKIRDAVCGDSSVGSDCTRLNLRGILGNFDDEVGNIAHPVRKGLAKTHVFDRGMSANRKKKIGT